MHSGALEPHSLFCTVQAPLATGRVCVWHKVVVAACELTAGTAMPMVQAAPATPVAASASMRMVKIMYLP
jgi:hypothetical protein